MHLWFLAFLQRVATVNWINLFHTKQCAIIVYSIPIIFHCISKWPSEHMQPLDNPIFYQLKYYLYLYNSLIWDLPSKLERGAGVLNKISCHVEWDLLRKACHKLYFTSLEVSGGSVCYMVWCATLKKATKSFGTAENMLWDIYTPN